MPYTTFNSSFTINQPNVSLTDGDQLSFRFILSSSSTPNFTASLSTGDLRVFSNAPNTGYSIISNGSSIIDQDTINITTPANVIVFTQDISSLYGGDYIYTPNPESGSQNPLYPTYGDIEYSFTSDIYDIIILTLEDSTKIEYRVLKVEIINAKVWVYLDQDMLFSIKEQLVAPTRETDPTMQQFLWLARKKDETNAYIVFNKREGQTSYGFVIPSNLASDVLANIDTITKEVKQKLLADQQGSIQP
jgi:cold shock CspA family protein